MRIREARWTGRTTASTAADLPVRYFTWLLCTNWRNLLRIHVDQRTFQEEKKRLLLSLPGRWLFRRNTCLLLVSQVTIDVGPTAHDRLYPSTGMSLGEPGKTILLATEMTDAALPLRQRTLIDMSLGKRQLRLNL